MDYFAARDVYLISMISYREANFIQRFSAEVLENTRELPFYRGGPAVDYTNALHAYALNATLLFDPERGPQEILRQGPSDAAELLLVERASGDGDIGTFSDVTGYIDTFRGQGEYFDPVAHTLREEFETECGFTKRHFKMIDFHAGIPTVEQRTRNPRAKITVMPVLGLCHERPAIEINTDELASYKWVGLTAIKAVERLEAGYRRVSLPSALGIIGLTGESLARLLD